MKIILLALGFLVFVLALITGAFNVINHSTYIIGGTYTVREGEIVHGNLELVFAQATLEKGSRMDGEIHSFSSAVAICGMVAGDISSYESDIKWDKSARIKSAPKDISVFPFVILLPKTVRWNLSIGV